MCLGGRLKKNKPLKTGKWKWWLCVVVYYWLYHHNALMPELNWWRVRTVLSWGTEISIQQTWADVERGWVDAGGCARPQTKLPSHSWVLLLHLPCAVAGCWPAWTMGCAVKMNCKETEHGERKAQAWWVFLWFWDWKYSCTFWFVYCCVFDNAQGVSVRNVFMVLWFR